MTTVVSPASAPIADERGRPVDAVEVNAVARLASSPAFASSVYLTMPDSTTATAT